MRKIFILSALACLVLSPALSGCGDREGLTVFAAASLTDALTEAGKLFEEREGVMLRLNFASSSTLARQIEAGAEADVYVSANVNWMDYLRERKLIVEESGIALFGNRLALVIPRGNALRVKPVRGTPVPEVLLEGRVAVGETRSVPAGIYARQALESLGWIKTLEPNLVGCDNARSALMLVARKETDSGIVYLSDAGSADTVEIAGIFPDETHDPIIYPAAVVERGRRKTGLSLLRFLSGPEAGAIFAANGFRAIDREERL